MKISESVINSIMDMQQNRFDSALLHACNAIDATARKSYPANWQVGRRFKTCLRDRYWILEPMIGPGFNLAETRFPVDLKATAEPDLADIIYEVLRCSHAHGDEVPQQFSIMPSTSVFLSQWSVAENEVYMPDKVVYALLGIAVFANVNADIKTDGTWFLSIGDDIFRIEKWWGKEEEFRSYAEKYNQVRIAADLRSLRNALADGVIENVTIVNPPFLWWSCRS